MVQAKKRLSLDPHTRFNLTKLDNWQQDNKPALESTSVGPLFFVALFVTSLFFQASRFTRSLDHKKWNPEEEPLKREIKWVLQSFASFFSVTTSRRRRQTIRKKILDWQSHFRGIVWCSLVSRVLTNQLVHGEPTWWYDNSPSTKCIIQL